MNRFEAGVDAGLAARREHTNIQAGLARRGGEKRRPGVTTCAVREVGFGYAVCSYSLINP